MPVFEDLSPKQQKIIQSRVPEFLILAGPGTGKTEILAHRIVDIINNDRDVEPDEILALTFSRRATSEMRNRLDEFTEVDTSDVKISTIHAESLRIYYQLEGSRKYILDKDESTMIIRDTLNDNGFLSRVRDINNLRKDISISKTSNILPEEIMKDGSNDESFIKLYEHYEQLLDYHNAMDFDDVILKPVRMLNGVQYDRGIKHLLIDEFQDINTLEFTMLQILGKNVEGLFIVGDDDQSIYGFRGANPTLIKTISKYYPACNIDCLEETHRCCEHIIRGALEIVSRDKNYVPKSIHSARGIGNPIKFLITRSEDAEARWIAQWIFEKVNEGYVEPHKIGILSKSLAMIPPVLDELNRRNIDVAQYVSGGIFRHRPVRDILSVARLMLDHDDNLAFRKCLSTNLASGIGKISIQELRNIAEKKRVNYWDVLSSIDDYSSL